MPQKKHVGLVVEGLSAVAVLTGLIFVGLELRNTTAAVHSATLQSLMDGSVDYVHMMAADSELTRIWTQASSNPAELTDVEANQYRFLLRGQWFRFQSAYIHWQRGTLSEKDWAIYEPFICNKNDQGWNEIGSRNRISTWQDHVPALTAEFVNFVEACRAN